MENIEKIVIDFQGHMELDKNDIVINSINEKGFFERVDVSKLTGDEIVEGLNNGDYYMSFEDSFKNQLDGGLETTFEVENE